MAGARQGVSHVGFTADWEGTEGAYVQGLAQTNKSNMMTFTYLLLYVYVFSLMCYHTCER